MDTLIFEKRFKIYLKTLSDLSHQAYSVKILTVQEKKRILCGPKTLLERISVDYIIDIPTTALELSIL